MSETKTRKIFLLVILLPILSMPNSFSLVDIPNGICNEPGSLDCCREYGGMRAAGTNYCCTTSMYSTDGVCVTELGAQCRYNSLDGDCLEVLPIRGYVRDNETDRPIISASLIVIDANNRGEITKGETRTDGSFEILLPVGTHSIQAKAAGYKASTQSRDVAADVSLDVPFNFYLQKDSLLKKRGDVCADDLDCAPAVDGLDLYCSKKNQDGALRPNDRWACCVRGDEYWGQDPVFGNWECLQTFGGCGVPGSPNPNSCPYDFRDAQNRDAFFNHVKCITDVQVCCPVNNFGREDFRYQHIEVFRR